MEPPIPRPAVPPQRPSPFDPDLWMLGDKNLGWIFAGVFTFAFFVLVFVDVGRSRDAVLSKAADRREAVPVTIERENDLGSGATWFLGIMLSFCAGMLTFCGSLLARILRRMAAADAMARAQAAPKSGEAKLTVDPRIPAPPPPPVERPLNPKLVRAEEAAAAALAEDVAANRRAHTWTQVPPSGKDLR